MKRSGIVAALIGLVLAATLLATNDLRAILGALGVAGWGIVLVVAAHLPQTFFSALGWRVLIAARPATCLLYALRWIRESVNALLPVAQIGGDVVRARLLAQRGVPLRIAVGSSMVDLSLETVAQMVFTIFVVTLLLAGPHSGDALTIALAAATGIGAIAIAFVLAQRFGLFTLIERGVAKWSASGTRLFSGDLSGLNDAVLALYRQPRRLAASTGWHLASWLAGGIETWVALQVLGLGLGLREAMIVEGLGQAVRAAGFLIPGALGVQEGGYVLICAMFGVSPAHALALSLVRRIRELALGLPGLALWHRLEARRSTAVTAGGLA